MGYTEMIRFNPNEAKHMIKRIFPNKKIEWLPLSEWGFVKQLDGLVALIFIEGDQEGKGTFYKQKISLKIDDEVKELYLKPSERIQIVDANTGHRRTFQAPIVKDIQSGFSTHAIVSLYMRNINLNQPHAMFVKIKVGKQIKISKSEASTLLETPNGCLGVWKDPEMRQRLY